MGHAVEKYEERMKLMDADIDDLWSTMDKNSANLKEFKRQSTWTVLQHITK